MAAYYRYGQTDSARQVFAVDDPANESFVTLDGTPQRENWTPPRVELQLRRGRRDLGYSDFMAIALYAPVVTGRVVDLRPDLLGDRVELLPLDFEGGEELFVCNTPVVEGAVDLDKSVVERFSSGKIMTLDRAVILDSAVEGLSLFRLAETPLGWVYASEEFRSALDQTSELVGPAFYRPDEL